MSVSETAVATRQTTPVDRLKMVISSPSVQEQFQNAMKDNSRLFVASLIDLYASDTNLQQCDPRLVVLEALKAATLKLPINKSLGFAYVVPYRKKGGAQVPQFQLGYRGIVQLAMRSGIYRCINADVVLEGELLRTDKLTGDVDLSGPPVSDLVVGYFAYLETTSGFRKTLYKSRIDIEAHAKRYSKAWSQDSSPWHSNFDEMAVKTTLRMLLGKYGLLSVEMAEAMAQTDDNDFGPIIEPEQGGVVAINNDIKNSRKTAKTPPPSNDQDGVNASSSAGAENGKKEASWLKELGEIDNIDSTDKLDIWLFKHCNRCTRAYGDLGWAEISGYASSHRTKLTSVSTDDGPETIICPESGGRMVKDDCAMSECSKMCPAFNVGSSKLRMEV